MVEAPHGVVRGAGPTRSNTGETRPGRTRPAPRTVVRGPAPHGLRGGGPSRSHTGRTLVVVQGPNPVRSYPGESRPGCTRPEPRTEVHSPSPARSCTARTPHGGAQSEPRTDRTRPAPSRSPTGAKPLGRTRSEPRTVVRSSNPTRVVHRGGPPRSYAGRTRTGHARGRAPAVVRGALAGAGPSRPCARRPCPVLPRPARSCSVLFGPCPVRVVRGPNLVRSVPVGGRPGRGPAGPTRPYAARPRTVVRGRGPARSYVAGSRAVVREAAGTRVRRGPQQPCPGISREHSWIDPDVLGTSPRRHAPCGPRADPGRTPGEAPDAPRGPTTPRAHVTWC